MYNAVRTPSHEEWQETRYRLFNQKIDSFKNHERYEWLRNYANDAISWNECAGYLMIKAEDFINRIEKMPLDYIKGWIDGSNGLEWKPEYR
ncbi:hypothetical protein AALB39_04315 [Lachnospiraceae bacterium 54-53]